MKNYFPNSEFIIASSGIPNTYKAEGKAKDSLVFWQETLNPIRDILSFRISITDWLRIHQGEASRSQHYALEDWSKHGAVDLQPTDETDSKQLLNLGLMLMANPKITRVAYYVPTLGRFTYGGFHLDCGAEKKQLFINYGENIKWVNVGHKEFITQLLKHPSDLRTSLNSTK